MSSSALDVLAGRVAIVTGGAARIAADGGRAAAIEADVTQSGSVERLLGSALSRFGGVDILINNAGMLGPIADLWETTDEEVDRVYALNVRSVFTCSRLVGRHMMDRRKGSIVTIASVAGKDGPKGMSIYASSKAAVIGFTKSWAKKLAPHGVRVNCVAPALIEASGMRAQMPDWFSSDSASRIPLRRLARAEEVAQVVAFLASDAASFVTGACYDVSGGRATY